MKPVVGLFLLTSHFLLNMRQLLDWKQEGSLWGDLRDRHGGGWRQGQAPRRDGNNHCTVSAAEYQTSIKEKLPLIVGSSAAGLVFLIAVVVIAIVCNRWVAASGPGLQP